MTLAPLLLLVALADDPTRPSMVALDFKDLPLSEIVRRIGDRSGNALVLHYAGGNEDDARRFTLESPEAVPFWDAVDRVCEAAKLKHELNEAGPFGRRGSNVALQGPSDGGRSPGVYSGPFRFGRFAIQSDYDRNFVTPPRTPYSARHGPCHAEFTVLFEPRLIAIRTGPLAKLEATDDRGRSILDPEWNPPKDDSPPPQGYNLGSYSYAVDVSLLRPEGADRRLKLLRGVMPVEVGVVPKEPALSIPLAGSSGKTFSVGDVKLTIEEFLPKPGGATSLKVVAKIEGPRGDPAKWPKGVVWARSTALHRQIEVVDANGRAVQTAGGTSSAGDELKLDFQFSNPQAGAGAAPSQLRVYAPNWVQWEVPFEFSDMPLP